MNKSDVELLVAFIEDMVYSEQKKELDPTLVSPELQQVCMALNTLGTYVNELKDFSQAFNVMIHRLQQREEEFQKKTTEATRMANEFQDLAYQDHDTGLFNRRYCMNLLEEWTARKLVFTICYVDLDDLKSVNDRLGHQEGDHYIRSFAEVMQKSFRSYDCVCRIGGDEFVVLMKAVSKKNAQMRIVQARDSFRQMGHVRGLYDMDFSYGIRSVECDNTKTPLELLNEADSLMYEAKKKKSNAEADNEK